MNKKHFVDSTWQEWHWRNLGWDLQERAPDHPESPGAGPTSHRETTEENIALRRPEVLFIQGKQNMAGWVKCSQSSGRSKHWLEISQNQNLLCKRVTLCNFIRRMTSHDLSGRSCDETGMSGIMEWVEQPSKNKKKGVLHFQLSYAWDRALRGKFRAVSGRVIILTYPKCQSLNHVIRLMKSTF